ncbi:capsid protein [Pseudaminobacter arsenicus]|uniref:Capsid protein n=1 Tax=Borborobacter arsenicus TaxID=1851146 RepID=A0A432VBW2_9HYPH|nr:capsid protein [Pseudaminobacter arsenicus]
MNRARALGYTLSMQECCFHTIVEHVAVTPSPRTRHAELLRLCARIGYSPPFLR